MNAKYEGLSVPPSLKDICEVGKHSYADGGSPNIVLHKDGMSKLIIGSFVSIGPCCNIILGSEHRTDFVSTFHFSNRFDNVAHINGVATKGDIVIGSDVWIGGYVTILSGVTIGHGAVIGAGAVVSKDVAPYTIVAGNPIREIRKRFLDTQIDALLKIKWWELPDDMIHGVVPLLMGTNVDEFISRMVDVRSSDE